MMQQMILQMTPVELQVPLTVDDMQAAREIFLTGGSLPVVGVTHWDGHEVGDGTVGKSTLIIRKIIQDDMQPPKDVHFSEHHTYVPYGKMTGMMDDFWT